ncbi:DMT family transporter [Sporosarcina sp. HYO08]|uniref:DMT family transporter n=1 Tax=Sporosarcina sp. HYO08 TaxID=1759557 RepID=UPI000791DAE2|nr:DMT family transporter [Sporosarcina sp. HYO08]KXH84010.1 hypothetical protein AU377_04455 [Sporosarcina sp. HYO08]
MLKIYLLLATTMVVWGLNLPLLKFLLIHVSPVTMTAFRILLAGLAVFLFLWMAKLLRKPTKQEWMFIVGGALLNVALHHYFLNMGLLRTTGTNAGLILGTGPVLTAVSAALIMRIFPSKIQWGGVLFGLCGISFVVLSGGEISGLSLGDLFIFISILVQVLSFLVISKASKTLDPRLMTAYMMLVGSVILLFVSIIQEPGEMKVFLTVPPAFWMGFITSALIGTAVGHLLYNYSIGKVGPSKAAIFMNLNTIFSLFGSAIFLGESITAHHLVGLVFIMIGVVLGSGAAEDLWKKRKQNALEN